MARKLWHHRCMTFPALTDPLVLASHNAGKLREIRALLEPLGLRVIDAGEAAITEPEETEDSFTGNAELKARHSAVHSGKTALADDSGLVVPALDGAPGIYSARWAGEDKNFTAAMQRVEKELRAKGHTPTGTPAYFVCALSLAWPSGEQLSVEGTVHGTLRFPPCGEKGFGYDPIFVATGMQQSFAEIDPEHKHAISHRADAFAKLLSALKTERLVA